ncbi:MAG: LAGLIDADG family homing endonuclease [archaeon]
MEDIIIGRSDSDRKKFGSDGTIFLGRHYIKMGRTTSLSNRLLLDISRSHVVMICGKRGGGKCLAGDTLITSADGSMLPIRDLANRSGSVVSLDDDLKIIPAQKEGFYSRTVNKTLKVTLWSGKRLHLTPEHPLLTLGGWQPASVLPVGSRIATPRIIPAFGDSDIPEAKIKVLAYLLAEGHLRNGFILFSNMDSGIQDDFSSAIRAIDPSLTLRPHGPGGVRVVNPERRRHVSGKRDKKGRFTPESVFDSRNTLRNWLEDIGVYGKKAVSRSMPFAVFSLPKHKLSLFLNRLFSCDGTIYREGLSYWKVAYSSASRPFAQAVSHLLLRFGVVSRLRSKRTSSAHGRAYEIEIKGPFVKTYLQEIGFFGDKEERQQLALIDLASKTSNPDRDTVPKEIWSFFKPRNWAAAGRNLGYKHPKALRESTRYAPSRQKLLQIALSENDPRLEALARSDIFWDEIVSVEECDGETEVYDFTVPGKHNFVANDVIVHNSYTMGVVAEGMADLPKEINKNLSFILLDTMGIYWTMKYPNKKDELLLNEWDLKAKPCDIKIFTPHGFFKEYKDKGIPTDVPFSIKPSELESSDWCISFDVDPNSPIGVVIERSVGELRDAGKEFDIKDIIEKVKSDDRSEQPVKDGAENHFLNADRWGVFSKEGTPLKDLAAPGQVTVLDVSCYATVANGWAIKCLVVGLVAQKLFIDRMVSRKNEEYASIKESLHYFSEDQESDDEKMPLVWLVLDEAHELLPNDRKTTATDPLVTILREGRQPGISLILATQQPGKIHTDVMTQSDTVISHRLTAKIDTKALSVLMQSYMREGLDIQLDNLPRRKGAALIFDDTNEKLYPFQVRPRFTWHGGEAPVAIHKKKKIFDF